VRFNSSFDSGCDLILPLESKCSYIELDEKTKGIKQVLLVLWSQGLFNPVIVKAIPNKDYSEYVVAELCQKEVKSYRYSKN